MLTLPLYLGLGGNEGDRRANLLSAIDLISEFLCLKPSAVSDFIETKSWGFDGPDFINCVVKYDLPEAGQDHVLHALALMHAFQGIEDRIGRKRDYIKEGPGRTYTDRPIDIDILLYGEDTINLPELTVPPPLMKQRDFVMVPLSQIR